MRNHLRIISFVSILLSTITTHVYGAGSQFTLNVVVSGATPSKGEAVLTLFDSKETFLKTPYASESTPIDSNGKAYFEVINLPPGTYAVSVFHDKDTNGKLNTGLFGIPKELVGFSKNAKGLLGPPKFSKAAFSITKDESIQITLGKAKD